MTVKKIEIQSDGAELLKVREFLTYELEKYRCGEKEKANILLGVQEILTNIIRYAYPDNQGKIQVTFKPDEEKWQVVIRDHGIKFDPTKIPDPNLPPVRPGGLGVFITKQVMDSVFYDPKIEKGNQIILTKYRQTIPKTHEAERGVMKVEQKDADGVLILILDGDLDFHTCVHVREILQTAINQQTSKVLLDLSRVAYIDSSGLATFVEAHQKMKKYGAKLALCQLSAAVRSVFEIAKLDMIFTIYGGREDALKAFV